MAEEHAILARGEIRWHSSEEDSGPDVGLSLGIGDSYELYVGELSNATLSEAGVDLNVYPDGWWLAFVAPDGIRVIAAVADHEAAHGLLDTYALSLRRPDMLNEEGEDLGALLDAARAEARDEVRSIVSKRLAMYASKRLKTDPLAEDCLNRYDAITHTIEALEHLEAEIAPLQKEGENG